MMYRNEQVVDDLGRMAEHEMNALGTAPKKVNRRSWRRLTDTIHCRARLSFSLHLPFIPRPSCDHFYQLFCLSIYLYLY